MLKWDRNEKKKRLMPERDPLTYGWLKYSWVIGIAVWGGAVHHMQKMRESGRSFSFSLALEQFLTSALSGIIAFYVCEIAQVNGLAAAIFIAMAGHMGGDFLLEVRRNILDKYMPSSKNARNNNHICKNDRNEG